MTLQVKLGNESTIAFLHTGPCLFKLIHHTPAFLYLTMESASRYDSRAFNLLGRYRDVVATN